MKSQIKKTIQAPVFRNTEYNDQMRINCIIIKIAFLIQFILLKFDFREQTSVYEEETAQLSNFEDNQFIWLIKNEIQINYFVQMNNHLSHSLISDDRRGCYFMMFMPHQLKIKQQIPNHIKAHQNHNFKFYMYKGLQIFNKTKDPISVKFDQQGLANLQQVQLTFFVRDYLLQRNCKFTLKLYQVEGKSHEQLIGIAEIQVTEFIHDFDRKGKTAFRKNLTIGNYLIDFHVFIQHDRFSLERIVKIFREQKIDEEDDEIYFNQESDIQYTSFLQRSPTRHDISSTQSSPNKKKTITIKIKSSPKPADSSSVEEMFSYEEPEAPKEPQIGFMKILASAKFFNQETNKPGQSQSLKFSRQLQEVPFLDRPSVRYNLKMIVFLFFSVFLIIQAMSPIRKAPFKKILKRRK